MIRKRILIALALCVACIGSVKAADSVVVIYDVDFVQQFTDPLVPGQGSDTFTDDLTAIAIQSHGNMVIADNNGTLYLLDHQMNLVNSITGMGTLVALAVQSDDKILAANSEGSVRLLDSGLSGVITRIDNIGSLTALAVQSDDKVLVANAEGQLRQYDSGLGYLTKVENIGTLSALAVQSDDKVLVANAEGTLRQYDSGLGYLTKVENIGTLSALAVQSNDYVLAGNTEGSVRRFDNNLTWIAKYDNLGPFTGIEVRSDDKIYLSTADATKGVLRLFGSDFGYITKQDYLHPITDIAVQVSDKYRATNSVPADGAINVPVDLAQLEWTTTSDPNFTYDVYFGTEGNMTYQGNQGTTTFALSQTLEVAMGYEWQIDTVVDGSDVYPGYTWSFSTPMPVCEITYEQGDLTGDCKVNMLDFAVIAANWLTCAWDPAYLCD